MRLIPRTIPGKILAIIGGIVLALVIVAVAQGASKTNLSSASVSTDSPPTSTATPVVQEVSNHYIKLVVTGSPADVTYGHGGSSTHGTSPMNVTEVLPDSVNDYTLTAVVGDQGGTVKVKIYIDGKLIAHAKATGPIQAADAVVVRNQFTGHWESGLGA
jgi:hypothetical protein